MKIRNYILATLAGILCLLQHNTAQAQNLSQSDTMEIQGENIVSVFPFSFVAGTIMAGYERLLNENRRGIKINLAFAKNEESAFYYTDPTNNGNNIYFQNVSLIYAEGQYRFYTTSDLVLGAKLYMAPVAVFKQIAFTVPAWDNQGGSGATESKGYTVQSGGAGYVVGVQAFMFGKLAVDLYAGGTMMKANGAHKIIKEEIPVDGYGTGIKFHVGFSAGIVF